MSPDSPYRSGANPAEDTLLEQEVREPKHFRVLLHNDDYTTTDFVVRILMDVFYKSPADAQRIMMMVHKKGQGVCGVYPAEVAETKVAVVHAKARQSGFPLRCSLEEV